MTLMTKRFALICAVTLLAMPAGCVKENDDPNPKPDTSVDNETNLCEEVAEVACYNMFECCTGAEIESILGTRFRGRAVRTARVGGCEAIVPEVSGRAWITGRNEIVIAPDDPLAHGFLLR